MKLSMLAAAATIALTGMAPGLVAPAAAQHTVVHERTVVRTGPEHHAHMRRVCHWQVHHHHRTQVCRSVR